MLLDVIDGILNRTDLLRIFVRDVDLERFFEREHELDQTERIRAEIVDERRLGLDVLLVDVQLLFDDALDLCGNVLSHVGRGCSGNPVPTARRYGRVSNYTYIPPFTRRHCPVTYAASSL